MDDWQDDEDDYWRTPYWQGLQREAEMKMAVLVAEHKAWVENNLKAMREGKADVFAATPDDGGGFSLDEFLD